MQTYLRKYFNSGNTIDPGRRIEILKALKESILSNLSPLYEALWKDLHKSTQESYLTEVSFVLGEIEYHIKHLRKWSKIRKTGSPITIFPSKSRIMPQPYGVVLIIAPWNYPFMLLLAPLVAAVSAGNCAMLKPSHIAVNTAAVCKDIINGANILQGNTPDTGRPVEIMTGGPEILEEIIKEKYDYIFYTGGAVFGKTVAVKAAQTLTPVTLELGGKSPCIITSGANLKTAAKKVAWGKFLNSGQTCIAPDYILVEHSVKEEFVKQLKKSVGELYGAGTEEIIKNRFYGRIISPAAFVRLNSIIEKCAETGGIISGGAVNASELFIEPTVTDAGDISYPEKISGNPAMQEEIFGPVLPVISYRHTEDAVRYINSHPKPLALYIFGKKHTALKVLKHTFSGGACINDTIMHIANRKLPFGGVGESGMGNYHGKYGFETFSHKKSYVVSPRNFDIPAKYPPYKWLKYIKKLLQ